MYHAGFLRDNQRPLTAAELHQNRRLSEIEVGTVLVGAVCVCPAGATTVISVTVHELPRPQRLPRLEVESKHGIAGFRHRIRVVVPGGYIQRTPLLIDGGCGPNRGSGRALLTSPSCRFRWFRNRIALPDRAASSRVKCDNTSAEG